MSGLTAASLRGLGARTFSARADGPCYQILAAYDYQSDAYEAAPEGSAAEASAEKAVDSLYDKLKACRAGKAHQDWLNSKIVRGVDSPVSAGVGVKGDPRVSANAGPAPYVPLFDMQSAAARPPRSPDIYPAIQGPSSPAPAPSAQAQVAAIRAQQAAAFASRQAAINAQIRPMTERQQMQTVLAVQPAGMGVGTKVALVVLGSVALLSLGGLVFGRK